MNYRSLIAQRWTGAAGIAGLFLLQSAFEALFCGGGLFGFWEITLALAVAPVILLLAFGSRAALIACAVLVPFILFANAAECAPYRGGGAAMGYVPAIIFGVPVALLAGLGVALAAYWKRRKGANEG
jgi:hypothetical protein